tara:strand:- start:124 stop:303 length:180 start_codon:yes stop_codon:yes gene_type:complete
MGRKKKETNTPIEPTEITLMNCHYCGKTVAVNNSELLQNPDKKYYCMGIICRATNKKRD